MKNPNLELVAWALLSICGAFSCATVNTDASAPGGGAGTGDAGADAGSSDAHTVTLAFVPQDTIPLKPKQRAVLTVQADPPGEYKIRFALPGGDAAADAVLDATDVESDADGVAHVTLIAPSKPTTFSVRASSPSAGQVVAYQGIEVSASGVTTLRVQPSYAGQRPITTWTATAQAGVSCSDLAGNPPRDGNLLASAAADSVLELSRVPVGVELAITVRAGHYIGGCVNQPALSEVEGNQVLVYASDRPLNLSASALVLSFGASDAHPAFDKLLQTSASVAENALLGTAKSDIAALLDGMREATPASNRDAFDAARSGRDWDAVLDGAFGKSAARRLRDPAQRWLNAGLSALNAPDALVGKLSSVGSGVAAFSPTAVGSATPDDSGLPGFFPVNWSADSNDIVQLSLELNWQPGRLVTALAAAPASAEFPEASSVERALSQAVDCAQVGQVLSAAAASADLTAFASCDQACAVSLCESAVAAAWARAQFSSGIETATLHINASGAAQVGDDARATALQGSWVGELRTDGGNAPVSGALSASSPP
ncbi:MAG TPA: hypothetical protein VFK05_34500 [Polyangiaceae bacterium]|nr:hypothetical protein [Polyangiaceae bacterium]